MKNKFLLATFSLVLFACSSTSNTNVSAETKNEVLAKPDTVQINKLVSNDSASKVSQIPASYKNIVFPEFKYNTPDPLTYRVEISDSITGYIVEDSSLPLASFKVIFKEATVPKSAKEIAAKDLLSGMFRRGGSLKNSIQTIDDSLEFISASISGGLSSRSSSFSVNALSRDFKQTAYLAKEIFTSPAFDSTSLEIQKAATITNFERRYDTPAAVLSALKTKVNYASSPRLYDATSEEYRRVSKKDLIEFGKGKFNPTRVIFAFAGNISKDSVVDFLKKYFADWNISPNKNPDSAETLKLLHTPGIYAVERPVTQANISMNQPFLKRPHPDYYPAAVASFILGGGGFSSRLTTRIRSDEGLAYSVYSTVGNSYFDSTLTTIALQTKAEQTGFALKLIEEEILKLAKEGPTEEELLLAKKTLIESLPSLFATSEDIAYNFAEDEFIGKKANHYTEYIQEIESVSKEQVQAMISKYFAPEKMTISIVGPAIAWKDLQNVKIIPLDSLEIRP